MLRYTIEYEVTFFSFLSTRQTEYSAPDDASKKDNWLPSDCFQQMSAVLKKKPEHCAGNKMASPAMLFLKFQLSFDLLFCVTNVLPTDSF